MPDQPILLSAIVVVGSRRERAQRVVDALCAQTRIDAMEIIVVDLAAGQEPRPAAAPGVRLKCVPRPELEPWGQARLAGVRQAVAPVVAFLEDHAYPAPGWADALIEAHQGPWVAVGYAFTNANPRTYLSRSCLTSDYGPWVAPAETGSSRFLPGNNVSYKRDLLLAFESSLDLLLAPDFLLHEICNQRGWPMGIAARALVAHENYEHLSGLLLANHYYCRLLAAHRVHTQGWGWARRLVYGAGAPLGAPVIKLVRTAASLRRRPVLWPRFIAALPVIVTAYFGAAIGESLGYLFGPGAAERNFRRWELDAERVAP